MLIALDTIKKTAAAALLFVGLAVSSSGCATTVSSTTQRAIGDSSQSNAVITVGGSGESYETIERLAEAYEAKTGTEFDFFPPSQTSSGVEGVKSNTFDLGGTGRLLTAAEADDSLTYLPLVVSPLVMVVHESVQGVTDISAAQIKAIYKGDITNWLELGGPDAAIVLFDVSEDESEKQLLRETYLGADLEVTSEAIVFSEDDEMVEATSVTDFSLAAVPFEDELEDLPVTVLSIDGVMPSSENVESGSYPMGLALGLTIAKTPTAETAAFVEFIGSDEGRSLLEEEDDDDD